MESTGIREQLIATYERLLQSIIDAAPKVLTGIALVVVALVVAKIVEKILRVALTRARIDAALERFGIDKSLKRLGIVQPPSVLVPRISYFLLLFLFAQTAAEALRLTPISNAIGSFLGYLPNIFSALVLILIGSSAGQFAGAAVARASKEAGIDYGAALGNLVSSLILFIAGIMAIAQLKIDTEIIRIVTTCTLAGLALAFGLSFGLGTRDITRNIMAGFYARKIFRAGEIIEIRGQRGVLKAITPVQVLVEGEDGSIAVANTVFLDETIRR